MWDDSALSATTQDSFMSYSTGLIANCTSLESAHVDHRERSSMLTTSITDLSQEFQLHSLQPQPLLPSAIGSLEISSSRPTYIARKSSTSMHRPNQKKQHRPSPIRRQSSSAKISKLMALAQGLEISGYDAPLDSILQDESIPHLQIDTSSLCAHGDPLSIPFSMPSQRELERQGIVSCSHHHSTGKGSQEYDPGKTSAGQRLVQKDIRVRTKWRGDIPGR